MKKIVFGIFAIIVILLSQMSAAAADYIVKFKSDIMSINADNDLLPLIPQIGLYLTDNPGNINFETVDFIEEDAVVELFGTYDYSGIEKQSAHNITEIKKMWNAGVFGKNIRVGVVDSGCNKHEALLNNLIEGEDFSGSNNMDDHIGHGTSVCGIIAAQYGFEVIGTAHKASVVPIKFIDRNSDGTVVGGTVSRLAKAIVSAVDDLHCDVINLSCGTIDSHALKTAIDYAVSKDVIIIAAVGNSGSNDYNYPAAYENVVGVGSVDGFKEHSAFSNINDSVFVSAPGEHVDIIYGTDQYGQSSGTSFSAPYVSGIIANMLEIDPKLCLSDIIDIISMTAEDLGRQGYDEMFGYGLVRADRIAEYMLKGMKIYTSGFDLCPEDDCYEVRLWVNEKTKIPTCILCKYDNEVLKEINIDNQIVDDNIYIFRLKSTPVGEYKFFQWYNFENIQPINDPLYIDKKD